MFLPWTDVISSIFIVPLVPDLDSLPLFLEEILCFLNGECFDVFENLEVFDFFEFPDLLFKLIKFWIKKQKNTYMIVLE